jgi:hypothetical protein
MTSPSIPPQRWRKLPTILQTIDGGNLYGIGQLERRMDDFVTVQMEIQASIDSQTSLMHDLFGHFGINPDD